MSSPTPVLAPSVGPPRRKAGAWFALGIIIVGLAAAVVAAILLFGPRGVAPPIAPARGTLRTMVAPGGGTIDLASGARLVVPPGGRKHDDADDQQSARPGACSWSLELWELSVPTGRFPAPGSLHPYSDGRLQLTAARPRWAATSTIPTLSTPTSRSSCARDSPHGIAPHRLRAIEPVMLARRMLQRQRCNAA